MVETQNPVDALNLRRGGKGWRPKAGDEVTGFLRAIDKGWSDWTNSFYPILTIEKDDGSLVAVHAFHAVLLSRLLTFKPRVGEFVGVKYHGQEKSNDGKRMICIYSFDVARPDEAASVEWESFPEPQGSGAVENAVEAVAA